MPGHTGTLRQEGCQLPGVDQGGLHPAVVSASASSIPFEIVCTSIILSDAILLTGSGQVTTDSFYASGSERGTSSICFRPAVPPTHSCSNRAGKERPYESVNRRR